MRARARMCVGMSCVIISLANFDCEYRKKAHR